jgi:hypothetical protein
MKAKTVNNFHSNIASKNKKREMLEIYENKLKSE